MSDSGSAYGKGFAMRMVVLILLLGLVTFGLYYDRMVLPQQANQTIDEVLKLVDKETDDGKGLPKDVVQETFGFEPTETREEGLYEIETYRFGRALPFLQGGQFVEVAYIDGALYQVNPNEKFVAGNTEGLAGVVMMPEDERTMPAASMGGPGGAPRPPNPERMTARIMRQDADEDGKISKEEVSDRMKDSFDEMDEDSDGFLTKEEVEKAVKARIERDKADNEEKSNSNRPPADASDDKAESDKKDETAKDETKDGSEKDESQKDESDDKKDDKSDG